MFERKLYRLLIPAAIFAGIGALAQLMIPEVLGRFLDDVIGHAQDWQSILWQLALLAAIAFIGDYLGTLLNTRVLSYFSQGVRQKLFARWQQEEMASVDRSSAGERLSRLVADVNQVADGKIAAMVQFPTQALSLAAILYFMARCQYQLAIMVAVLSPLSLFVTRWLSKSCHKRFRAQVEARGRMNAAAEDFLSGLLISKAFAAEAAAEKRFATFNEEAARTAESATFLSSFGMPFSRLINNTIYALAALWAAFLALQGEISLGTFTAFLAYARQFSQPFNNLADLISLRQNAKASEERLAKALAAPLEPLEAELDPKLATKLDGAFRFEQVDFHYLPERPLIEDLQLEVAAAEHVAIVGPSGAGKSTLMNLLLRFYDVQGGSISLDGQNIRELPLKSYRRSFGLVLQEAWIKSATVAENIALGRPGVSREAIIRAAEASGADYFIRQLPEQYDTVLVDNGAQLSHGERQLLSLARLFLAPPPILLLDEATSSLDLATEQRVQAAFQNLMAGKTSFVVAHRLATIRQADCILVLRDGQIVEQGRHADLLARKGFYYELYMSQYH